MNFGLFIIVPESQILRLWYNYLKLLILVLEVEG